MIMSYFHILKSYFISTYIKNQWISRRYRLNLFKKNYFIYFNILFNNISYITFFILRLQHIKITYKNSSSKTKIPTNQPPSPPLFKTNHCHHIISKPTSTTTTTTNPRLPTTHTKKK